MLRSLALAILLTSIATPALGGSGAAVSLEAAIERFVRERAPVPPSSITVPPLRGLAVPGIASGDVKVALSTHPRTRFMGRVPITVTLTRGGQVLRRAVVTPEVRVTVPVVVAARSVGRGQPIRDEDLVLEHREVRVAPDDWVEDPSEITGFRARRRVTQGTPWKRDWAELPPSVRRGQAVRLELRRGPLAIMGRGELRQDGRPGEWVRVLNIDSKREIWGQVASDGTIHVEF